MSAKLSVGRWSISISKLLDGTAAGEAGRTLPGGLRQHLRHGQIRWLFSDASRAPTPLRALLTSATCLETEGYKGQPGDDGAADYWSVTSTLTNRRRHGRPLS